MIDSDLKKSLTASMKTDSRKSIEDILEELPNGARMQPNDVLAEAQNRNLPMTGGGIRKLMPDMLRSGIIRNDVDGYYHRKRLTRKELADAPRKELIGYARRFLEFYQHQRHIELRVMTDVLQTLLDEYKARYEAQHPSSSRPPPKRR
jgi:hypothetical protein